jgi:hypothetical protein
MMVSGHLIVQHEKAPLPVQALVAACPESDIPVCRAVEVSNKSSQ